MYDRDRVSLTDSSWRKEPHGVGGTIIVLFVLVIDEPAGR